MKDDRNDRMKGGTKSAKDDSNSHETDSPKSLIFEGEESLLLHHDYDGIQELDHPLPSWWLSIFYISIVFSIFYAGYYLTGIGPTLYEELDVAMEQIEATRSAAAAQAQAGGNGAGSGDDLILANLQNPDRIKNGATVYMGKCAACHGDQGQGTIGPNLTDDHWLHGKGSPQDVAQVIRAGVPEKGMPPWGPLLSADELVDVTVFIRSLHGTKPANAKEAQGELYETL